MSMEKRGEEGKLGEGKQRDGGRHGKDGEGGHKLGVGEMIGGTWRCGGEDVGGKQGTDRSAYGEDGDGGWGLGVENIRMHMMRMQEGKHEGVIGKENIWMKEGNIGILVVR